MLNDKKKTHYIFCKRSPLVNTAMIRISTARPPTHPGEMLLEKFLNPMQITQRDLADAIHVPYQRINEIINGKRGVTPSTALRLAKYFNTSTVFWMNLQQRCDLYEAIQSEESVLKEITPVRQDIAAGG